jgi:hypothetical protein
MTPEPDPETLALAHKAEALARDYRACFETEPGRRVLDDILHAADLFEQRPWASPHLLAQAVGRRSLAIHILAQLRWQPGDLLRRAQNHAEAELERRQRNDDA